MSSPAAATVFVIDDDGDVRASIQRLLKTVGLHGEAFASARVSAAEHVGRRKS
jgi:FixJ family two-component response regulator